MVAFGESDSLLITYVADLGTLVALAAADLIAATGSVVAAAKKLAGGPADGLLYCEPSTVWPEATPHKIKAAETPRSEGLRTILFKVRFEESKTI
jgi:hypothetical protein